MRSYDRTVQMSLVDFFTFYFLNDFFKFIYLLGGWEREKENLKQVPYCRRRARCGARTHETGDHDLRHNQESDT